MNSLSQFLLHSHSSSNDMTEQRELLQPPLLQREMPVSYTARSTQSQIRYSVWLMPFLELRAKKVRENVSFCSVHAQSLLKDS